MANVKPKLGSGERFKELQGSVAKEYEKKGVSTKKAEAIGAAVAAKQGIKKYGQNKMTQLAQKGKFQPKTKGEKQAGEYL